MSEGQNKLECNKEKIYGERLYANWKKEENDLRKMVMQNSGHLLGLLAKIECKWQKVKKN